MNFNYKLSTAIEFGYYGLEASLELSNVYANLLVKNLCQVNTKLSEYQFRKVRKEFHNIGIKLVLQESNDSIHFIDDESGDVYTIFTAYLVRFKNTIVLRDTLMELLSEFKGCLDKKRKLKNVYIELINNLNKFLKDKFDISFSTHLYDYDNCETYFVLYYQKPIDILDIYNSIKDYNLVESRFYVDIISVSQSNNTIDYVCRYRVRNIERGLN